MVTRWVMCAALGCALGVGWEAERAAPGFTAFLDELALDDDRIGCD